MKKRLLFSVMCILIVSLSAQVAIGQSTKVDSIMSSSNFFKSGGFTYLAFNDKTKEVPIIVAKETSKLTLQIGSVLKLGGGISFDIFDPNGKKQDGFGMSNTNGRPLKIVDDIPDTDYVVVEIMDIIPDKDYVTTNKQLQAKHTVEKRENSTEMEGQFLREFSNPLTGKWIVKVIPRNKDGKFKVNHIVTMK